MTLVNESTMNARSYDRAMGGTWTNPLDPHQSPAITVDVSRVIDEEVDGETISTELRHAGRKTVPYSKDAIIDPGKYGIPLPPISHDALYGYIKALTLDAMMTPEPVPALQTPPTPIFPKFPPKAQEPTPEAQP